MEEALIKRVMPHSIEAEQSVVGAMLMDKDAITAASEMISGSDFYQSAYGVIFDSMVELFNEGKPVDLITLQERLREKEVPAEIASLEFVRDLGSRPFPRLPISSIMPRIVAGQVHDAPADQTERRD